jgi:hypothetical protein
LRLAVCAPAPVSHFPGPAPGACFAGSHSPRPPHLAPPTPQPAARLCSPATIAESDFPRPFIIGYGSSPSRCGPEQRTAAGQTWDLPVPVQGASAHARFFDHAGPFGPCDGASETCCLPRSKQRRRPGLAFAAPWLAYALPYRRFVGVLTDANARLGADVDRYTFIVVDLHHLLLAGLPAHFESSHPSQAVRSLCAPRVGGWS